MGSYISLQFSLFSKFVITLFEPHVPTKFKMAKLTSVLPPEILQAIIKQVEDKSTLCKLVRCSHYLYEVTVPFLYEHVELYDYEGGTSMHWFMYLRPLTSLLLQRADLAYLVRRLTMREEFSDGYDSRFKVEEGLPANTVEVADIFKHAVEAASHNQEEEKEWLTHLSWADHADAMIALLLPALPRLEKLDLQLMYDSMYFERMLKRAGLREKPFDKQPAFLALKDFMHTWYDEKYGMSPMYVAMFLRLPAIDRIFGHRIGSADEQEDQTLAMLDVGSSTVTHLEFKDCKLSTEDITQLLKVPQNLTAFIYELGSGHLSYTGYNFKAIREALVPQAHSLENLWLGYEKRYGICFLDEIDDTTPIPSFASFNKLKTLKIATVFLFGSEGHLSGRAEEEVDVSGERYWNDTTRRRLVSLFPQSLETLHILHYEDHTYHTPKALADLLVNKSQNVPKLNKLVIEGIFKNKRNLGREMMDLAGLAKSKDTDLIFVCNDNGWYDAVERGWGMDGEITWAEGVNLLNSYPDDEIYRLTTEGLTRMQ